MAVMSSDGPPPSANQRRPGVDGGERRRSRGHHDVLPLDRHTFPSTTNDLVLGEGKNGKLTSQARDPVRRHRVDHHEIGKLDVASVQQRVGPTEREHAAGDTENWREGVGAGEPEAHFRQVKLSASGERLQEGGKPHRVEAPGET